MDQTIIDDFKQFIQATVSQATADLATKAELAELATKQDLADFESRTNQRFDDLDLKLSTVADAHSETLEDHEQRLTKLEHHKAAA